MLNIYIYISNKKIFLPVILYRSLIHLQPRTGENHPENIEDYMNRPTADNVRLIDIKKGLFI